ncbi:MAG: TetM/TetW/TetO/TetS family tetracycline resistance ribosomal protection protein [Chloroflexia bacterium]|nr:TetM/TetW/TetO/TetS family tetracycline resistance ribosomal protection protein [Chloroflexia bacterium]
MAIINIGILAHVDAGKTSLTERILYETGVITAVGSVDKGTTQTDTMELERARGITITSAVVSFQLNQLTVNLIDTPGHPDFIAEVARSLRVLDGVVVVVSAVEGVQAQTRRLVRAVRVANLPLLLFVNKIDRPGARGEELIAEIRRTLKLRLLAMNVPIGIGVPTVAVATHDRRDPLWREEAIDLLAETDERVIAEFDRTGGNPGAAFLAAALRTQIAASAIVPVFFGSAITGVGVPQLLAGVEQWLPVAAAATDAPASGTVFKITRRPSGEKIVYIRLFTGSVAVRQRVLLRRRNVFGEVEQVAERLTGIDRFTPGTPAAAMAVSAGNIVALHGLRAARIGDTIGDTIGPAETSPRQIAPAFPAPALESVVRPVDPGLVTPMRAALEQLAEQDPLISLRQRNQEGEVSLRLYGDVQKEVMTETLAREYGIAVTFGPSRTIHIERPAGTSEHAEIIYATSNPFYATVGFRIEPAEAESGIRYLRELGALPPAFYRAIEETVYETFAQGLHGWDVTDGIVTLTHAGFSSVLSTAADFRKLTPLVLMQALRRAGTQVYEPVEALDLDIPEETFGAVCGALVNARATVRNTFRDGASQRIICEIPTAELRSLEHQLPGLTHGDGDWIASFAGYVPVTGDAPTRARVGPNPLNRAHYLAEVARV